MPGEGTTAIFVTFFLAMLGYSGLTAVLLLSLRGNLPLVLWRAVAAVIFTHVFMVWTFRYGWQFDLAVRNGYAGFLLFHGALLMILVSTVSTVRIARLLISLAFLIVTVGALGATLQYDVVAIYRMPVILCALAGGAGLAWVHVVQKLLNRTTEPAAKR